MLARMWTSAYPMRNVLVLFAGLLTIGCTAMLREVSPTPSPNYASLSFRAADGRPLGEWDGIWYVDGRDFDRPRSHVYVARGRRIIGYNCPGWVSVDGYVGLHHRFEGGKRYEMVCEKKGPVIHALPDAGA